MVTIDHATRYVDTAALYYASAESTAALILRNMILRHGPSRVLIKDRGPPFYPLLPKQELLRA